VVGGADLPPPGFDLVAFDLSLVGAGILAVVRFSLRQ